MLLTKNNAALGLLFDCGILSHKNARVLFGSDFPLDQTDLQICLNIQRVKNCMAEGITTILVVNRIALGHGISLNAKPTGFGIFLSLCLLLKLGDECLAQMIIKPD